MGHWRLATCLYSEAASKVFRQKPPVSQGPYKQLANTMQTLNISPKPASDALSLTSFHGSWFGSPYQPTMQPASYCKKQTGVMLAVHLSVTSHSQSLSGGASGGGHCTSWTWPLRPTNRLS